MKKKKKKKIEKKRREEKRREEKEEVNTLNLKMRAIRADRLATDHSTKMFKD